MSWKYQTLDKLAYPIHSIFIEKYGLCTLKETKFSLMTSGGKNSIDAYYCDDGNLISCNNGIPISYIDKEFYKLKKEALNKRDEWGYYRRSFSLSDCTKIDKCSYKVIVYFYKVNDTDGREKYWEIEVADRNSFKKIKVWANDEHFDKYIKPNLYDLNPGDKLYYDGKGECEVVDIMDNLNSKSEHDLKVKYGDITEEVRLKSFPIYKIPMDGYKTEMFNKSFNEYKLSPTLDRTQNVCTLYWHEVDETACYKVKIYKTNRSVEAGLDEAYVIKEIIVNRNDHMLILNDLNIRNLVFVVLAENRKGETIAQSRGIKISETSPRTFGYSD